MRGFLIDLLFSLLGNSIRARGYAVPYLFGASTSSFDKRKQRWEKALARLYRDKDLLDFLYYQSEHDKETAFNDTSRKQLFSIGARIRTLFIVYSARKAYLHSLKGRAKRPDEQSDVDTELKSVANIYKQLTNVNHAER